MKLLDSLNETQVEAVKQTEGYVRVIAGAGSGKTRLLTSRYVYLVKVLGIDPSNILCVTFTNKAANEMKKRIKYMIGETCNPSYICTYHGLCVKIIKENPEKLFLPNTFQIIDTYQQKTILSEIYQKYELKLDHASFERTLKNIVEYKNSSDYVSNFIEPKCKSFNNDIETLDERIIEEYLLKQKNTYSLDFEDLINFAIFLLKNDNETRDKWQKRLNYIQVDEFQDSSKKELELIDLLSYYFKNVLIVGDPDQNIYEWRGSDVSLLVDYDKTHENTKTIFLNQNYRSTTKILDCANNLIEKNEYRLKKDLFTKNGEGLNVDYYHSSCDNDETSKIVEEIKSAIRNNYSYDDIAILYRTNFLSRVIEKKLVEENIPYEIYGGVKFYQRMEIQDILAYLKVIAYNDDQSLKRIINTPRRKFGRTKLNTLMELNENSQNLGINETLFETLKKNIDNRIFTGSGAKDFICFIDNVKSRLNVLRIADIVEMVCNNSGYEEYIRSLGDNERLENLSEFKRIADEFERNFGEELTLNEFLQQISLQTSEDENQSKDKVKLMTIHTAKGLEFPIVFLVGLSEGIFPSSRTIEERKKLGLEEERRLCYVAITRAMKKLYLMESEGVSNNNLEKFPSRFLNEIGSKNYITHGNIPRHVKDGASLYRRKLDDKIKDGSSFETGKVINHHVFGDGTIIDVDYSKRSYLIQFGDNNIVRNISFDYFENSDDDIEIPNQEEKHIDDFDEDSFDDYNIENIDNNNEDNDCIEVKTYDEDGLYLSTHYIREEELDNFERYDEYGPLNRNDDNDIIKEIKKPKLFSLWGNENVPHSGWICVDIQDLGMPSIKCEMCGKNIIRYVHYMEHKDYPNILKVGCVCAGKMEGNIEAAKYRERQLKSNDYYLVDNRQWKKSIKGNDYMKYDEHVVVIYQTKDNKWRYSIDGIFSKEGYKKKKDAKQASVDILKRMN